MSIHYIIFFTDGKFGDGSKLGSGEGKQLFRPEGGEDGRKSLESKLTFLFANIRYGLRNFWPWQYIDQKYVGGLNPCIIYCYHSFCENFMSVSRQVL